jgi:protein ImuA
MHFPVSHQQSPSGLQALLSSSQLWHADAWCGLQEQVVSTGHPALDAALPSGGWPVSQLIEVLADASSNTDVALIAPALSRMLEPAPGQVAAKLVLIDPPYELSLPAWEARGVPVDAVFRIDTDAPAEGQACSTSATRACWAIEQALRCAHIAAVLAWLPRVPMQSLRRLQVAAASSQALLMVFRPRGNIHHSPAPMRLGLQRLSAGICQVDLLKCKGLASEVSVQIEVLSRQLLDTLRVSPRRRATGAGVSAPQPSSASVLETLQLQQTSLLHRMPSRSQSELLLGSKQLFGNERAVDGPAMHVKAHHGLDCPPASVHSPSRHTELPERHLIRAARLARSH